MMYQASSIKVELLGKIKVDIFHDIWVPNCLKKRPLFSTFPVAALNTLFQPFKTRKNQKKIPKTHNFITNSYFIKNWGWNSKIGNSQVLGIFMLYKSALNKFRNTLPFSGILASGFQNTMFVLSPSNIGLRTHFACFTPELGADTLATSVGERELYQNVFCQRNLLVYLRLIQG